MSSRFSCNSETKVSELQENLEEMYYMHSAVGIFQSHGSVLPVVWTILPHYMKLSIKKELTPSKWVIVMTMSI